MIAYQLSALEKHDLGGLSLILVVMDAAVGDSTATTLRVVGSRLQECQNASNGILLKLSAHLYRYLQAIKPCGRQASDFSRKAAAAASYAKRLASCEQVRRTEARAADGGFVTSPTCFQCVHSCLQRRVLLSTGCCPAIYGAQGRKFSRKSGLQIAGAGEEEEHSAAVNAR